MCGIEVYLYIVYKAGKENDKVNEIVVVVSWAYKFCRAGIDEESK